VPFFIWVFLLLLELTPEQRSLRARTAAHESWANTSDPAARTAHGRATFLNRFEADARAKHPDGDDATIARVAESLRKAHFTRLALASSKARTRRTSDDGGGPDAA